MFYWSDKTSYVKTREWNQITQHHRKNRWNHDWNKLWKDPVGITWVFAFKKYNPVVLKCPPSFFVICMIRAYRVQNLTPEESKYKCEMPKQLQPFPSNISCDAFSAWSRVPRFPPISLHLFFSLALMVVYLWLKNTGPVDYYSTAELQAVTDKTLQVSYLQLAASLCVPFYSLPINFCSGLKWEIRSMLSCNQKCWLAAAVQCAPQASLLQTSVVDEVETYLSVL